MARPYSQKRNSEGNWLEITPNCATLKLVLVGGFAVQLARSIRWCVVALLPTILLVAFLVGVEARVPQMIEPGAVILSEVDVPQFIQAGAVRESPGPNEPLLEPAASRTAMMVPDHRGH